MLDSSLLLGLENLCRGRKAFFNCTREVLIGGLYTILPQDLTVLEVLENISPDAEVIAACQRAKEIGYQLALDDFLPSPAWEPLVEIANILKVDLQIISPEQRAEILRVSARYRTTLLAEKVETAEEFRSALSEGYKYFQGYYFCRPAMLEAREIPPNQGNHIRLFAALNQPQFDLIAIERIVKSEPSLSYRLLRRLNSVTFGFRDRITSIRHAVMLLGEREFRKWAMVSAVGVAANGQPPEVIADCLARARFCEILSPLTEVSAGDAFFAGMLSRFDAVLALPLPLILEQLPLSSDLKAGLTGGSNAIGQLLHIAEQYERCEWQSCRNAAGAWKLTERDLSLAYLESIRWAEESCACGAEHHDEDEPELLPANTIGKSDLS